MKKIQDKKSAILKATLEIISEQGFQDAPMSQIAERANIGAGTIYRYFSSKDDLVNSLYIEIKTCLAEKVSKTFTDLSLNSENFLLFLRVFVDYFIENPKEFLFLEQYSNSPAITKEVRQECLNMFDNTNSIFKKTKELDSLNNLPTEIHIAIVNGAMMSLIKLYIFSDEKPKQSVFDSALNAIWESIKR